MNSGGKVILAPPFSLSIESEFWSPTLSGFEHCSVLPSEAPFPPSDMDSWSLCISGFKYLIVLLPLSRFFFPIPRSQYFSLVRKHALKTRIWAIFRRPRTLLHHYLKRKGTSLSTATRRLPAPSPFPNTLPRIHAHAHPHWSSLRGRARAERPAAYSFASQRPRGAVRTAAFPEHSERRRGRRRAAALFEHQNNYI